MTGPTQTHTLLYNSNWHNTENQVYFNKKYKILNLKLKKKKNEPGHVTFLC